MKKPLDYSKKGSKIQNKKAIDKSFFLKTVFRVTIILADL